MTKSHKILVCMAMGMFFLSGFPFFCGLNQYLASASEGISRQIVIDAELDSLQRKIDFSSPKRKISSKISQSQEVNVSESSTQEQYYLKDNKSAALKTYKKPYQSLNKSFFKNDFLNIEFEVLGGYRKDKLTWNIAGDETGQNPNILSELTWEDLEMSQTSAKSRIILFKYFVADARGSYADIYEGKNQDSDYLSDDRTLEFSRSNNNAHDGEAFDVGGSFGFRFPLKPNEDILEADNVWVTLMGGYSRSEQHLIMTDGMQTVPFEASFEGLHNTYKTEWKGPFVGLEFEAKQKKLSGFLRSEYHWVDYYGEANWNLRDEFAHPKSFEHVAKGTGLVFNLGGAYQITDWWALNLEGTIQRWKTGPGIDRLFLDDGFQIETRLNDVYWTSYSVMLGTTFSLF